MLSVKNTICAPVHQPGSAITIIRVTGPDAILACEKIFRAKKRGKLSREKGFSLVFGEIFSGDVVYDEVLLSVFRSPHSYTGEDMVEIACHGSVYIQSAIIRLLINNGVSPARAGEFTQRAFLNGKMDLSQAEAVADLISSESESAHRIAMNQLKGGFSAEISRLRQELLNLVSLLELELDFGEEDVQFADRTQLLSIASTIKEYSDRLTESFSIGNAIKRGIPVAIAGRPNVGKSTILNGLLNEERAIVSEIPGTTRDTIEDTFTLDGVLFRFIDTAGIRATDDIIENLGIKKTFEKISTASIVILVTEASVSPADIRSEVAAFRKKLQNESTALLVVVNKTDLAAEDDLKGLKQSLEKLYDGLVIYMTAKHAAAYSELKSAISQYSGVAKLDGTAVIVTNSRHYEALKHVSESIGRVLEGLSGSLSSDLIAIDARHAIHFLGEITGEISTDEILGNIFKNFCIGK